MQQYKLTCVAVLFVNLGTYIKLILDVETHRDPIQPGELSNPKYTHAVLLEIFHTIPLAKAMRKHRPELSDFYLDPNYRAKATKKDEHAAFHDPDADDLFGCPVPPPGVGIHDTEEGLYDNPDEVQKRACEVQDHLNRRSAHRNSTAA